MSKLVYVAVMGTMGSGKTSTSNLIAKHLDFHLLEENFGENAFLPRFYDEMKRWAFHSQAFYLMEKITQMINTAGLLKKKCVVQDAPIQQDVFSYAKAQHVLGNMDDAEWRLYTKIYKSFEPYLPKPDMIIYLDTSVTSVVDRIKQRGRGYEQEIPQSYLELLDMLNQKWLTENRDIPVLHIETDHRNIIKSPKAREEVVDIVSSALKKRKLR